MKKNETAIEVKVGALVLFSLMLLGGFIYLLGDFGFEEGQSVYVDYQDISGLKPGAQVKQGGIQIGSVKQIEFMEGEDSPVTGEPIWARVELEIDTERFPTIRQSSQFYITTEGVLGEKFVSIRTEDPSSGAIESGHVFRGVDPLRMEEMIAKVNQSLDSINQLLGNKDIPISQLVKHLDQLIVHADEILVENRPSIANLLTHVDTLIVNTDETIQENRETIRSLLTNADTLTADAKQAVKAFVLIAGRLDKNFGPIITKVSRVLSNADTLSATLVRISDDAEPKVAGILDGVTGVVTDVDSIMGDVKSTSSQVASITDYIYRGQGTIGLLIRDEEIFDNVREMLRELKRRPWKIVWKE